MSVVGPVVYLFSVTFGLLAIFWVADRLGDRLDRFDNHDEGQPQSLGGFRAAGPQEGA